MDVYWSSVFGFFLGFAFGVGCALAVMYSIYMGGYRAAVRDSLLAAPPERLRLARSQALAPAPQSPNSPEPDPATPTPDPHPQSDPRCSKSAYCPVRNISPIDEMKYSQEMTPAARGTEE